MLYTPILLPRRIRLFITVAVLALVLPIPAPTQDLARRLILKDGSYQLVTQYEVKGDRVRYKSAERDDWEELPSSLVDWPATEKYEKQRAAAPALPEASTLDKDIDTEESQRPLVAPGLRLPEDSGVFLLDTFQGLPQLVEMQQAEGGISRNSRGNILRGAINPAASAKQTVELEGEHAIIHAHVAVPSIYINVDESDQPPAGETASAKISEPSLDAPRDDPRAPQRPEKANAPFDRFRIVRAKPKNGKRIVGDIKRAVTGKVSQDQDSVKVTINRISGGWFKLTPTEDLAPGEYVVVEMSGSDAMNLYVWDFGVNPNAPANANPWKPETKEADRNNEKSKDAARPQAQPPN